MSRVDSEAFNPYSSPLTGPEATDPFQQDDTRIRQQFIDCEANVKTIAGLLTLGGIALAGACMFLGFVSLGYRGVVGQLPYFVLATLLGSMGTAQIVVGFQVGSFHPSARIWAILFCSLWLLFIPIGTFFGGACLWYLARPAAKHVFTREYLNVIQRTPDVQFRTSYLSWGILIIVLLATMGLFVAVSFRL